MTALEQLTEFKQWVCWRWMAEDEASGKMIRVTADAEESTKVPFQINGKKAASNRPNEWSMYAECVAAAAGGAFDGVGFMFADSDPFSGVDLDKCVGPDGTIAAEAMEIITAAGSYAEISPSGTGVKLWMLGTVADSFNKPMKTPGLKIEAYSRLRFFTFTGRRLGEIDEINGAQELLHYLTSRYNPPKPIKPRPAPTSTSTSPTSAYTAAAISNMLDRAERLIASAAEGNRHNARYDAGRLVGGLIGAGYANYSETVERLYNALRPRRNIAAEWKAIEDGVQRGIEDGIEIPQPPPPPAPAFNGGWALCPKHGRVLRAANNGNGYKCREKDSDQESGWCAFWWQGEGYTPPTGAAPKLTRAADLPAAAGQVDGQSSPAPSGKLYHADQLGNLPPVEWLIKDELPANSVGMLYGATGTFKSFHVIDWCGLISQHPDRRIVYVAAEGQSGYDRRVNAWIQHHKGANKKNMYFWLDAVNMMDESSIAEFVGEILPLAPSLIILDTLQRCSVGADENSSRDMGIFYDRCDKLRRATGATVLFIHHTGKNGVYRGSSVLTGNPDVVVRMTIADGLVKLEWEKMKDQEKPPARYTRMIPVADSLVPVPARSVLMGYGNKLSEAQRKILEVLNFAIHVTHGATSIQIEHASEVPKGSIGRALSTLKELGYMYQKKPREPYFITDKGIKALRDAESEDDDGDTGSAYGVLNDYNYVNDQPASVADQDESTDQPLERAAPAEPAPERTLETAAATVRAVAFINAAIAELGAEAPDFDSVNDHLADYESECMTHQLPLWAERRPDYDRVDQWLADNEPRHVEAMP
jgi:hypothetical protein